ncbi:unnamed protein product [Mytilus coruscus]|uniref:Uncharacterized protein n=1 Tax=Mytilus coruscus TaxID=42192 RepID=A0A6J8CVZ1_MYTCO|nr:unnamed protein product [Mytilus coruscus]
MLSIAEAEYSEYVKNETFSTGNKVVNQSHTIDQLQLQNTTPIISSEFDSSLQRPETLPSRNISRKRHRRRRYDYEDSHDWNYDLEDLDYDENNFAVVTCVVRTCVGPSVPSVVCSFLTVSIYADYVDVSRTIQGRSRYVFLKKCGCIKDDPAYNQMKFICKAMGMELDYKTYLNMKQSLEETIIEQGSDPNNLAKLAG